MTPEVEKRQWKICPVCGGEKTVEATVQRLMTAGRTREQAVEFMGDGTAWLNCPQEHINPVKVPLRELEHGAYYHGHCRNATVARWDANKQQFVYWREKFRYCYTEAIGYWVEGHHFDEFQPYGKVENPPFEIPLEAEVENPHM